MATTAISSPRPANRQLTVVSRNRQELVGGITRAEIRFVAWTALALGVLSTLPYALGRFLYIRGTIFTGILNHSLDSNNYMAYIHQAASGHWLFRNPMTPEPHTAVFFNLEWLVAGKIAALLHVSLAAAVDMQRLFCLVLMCAGVYWLASNLFSSVLVRQVALVAVMAGGGFGWIAAVHVLHIPLNSDYFQDLSNGNLFPFYWALKLPHFLISESFVVLGLALFVHAERRHQLLYYVSAGIAWMAAGACRPYDMLFVMLAVGLFTAVSLRGRRDSLSLALIRLLPVALCVPVLAYYFWIFKLHPVFRWWSNPGSPGPAPWILALSYGPSFLVFLYSLGKLRKRISDSHAGFMICCLVTACVLSYCHHWLHFAFQFATSIVLPMLMVAFLGLEETIAKWEAQTRRPHLWIAVLLLANSLTSLALSAQVIWLVKKGDFRADAELVNAFHWVNAHSQAEDVVLADFETSNEMAQYTHNAMFCGYINAVDFNRKADMQERFLDPKTTDQFRRSVLQAQRIRFVLLTREESVRLDFFHGESSLSEVFENNSAVVFETGRGNQGQGFITRAAEIIQPEVRNIEAR